MALALTSIQGPLEGIAEKLQLQNEPEVLGGIESLANEGRVISGKFAGIMENDVSQMLTLITVLVNAQVPDSTMLPKLIGSITDNMVQFRSTKCDVTSMQTTAHSQIERSRGRKNAKESEINSKKASIESLQGQIRGLEQQISTYNKDANDMARTAQELDERGHSVRRAAKKKKRKGLFGGIVGVALAPFTGGASLVAGGIIAGINVNNADDCFRKANQLRAEASRKQENVKKIRSQIQSLTQDKSRAETEMEQLRQQNDKLLSACNVLDDVTSCLVSSVNLLENIIEYFEEVEYSLQEAKTHSESFRIIQAAFSGNIDSMTGDAVRYVDNLKTKWMRLETLLIKNGARRLDQN